MTSRAALIAVLMVAAATYTHAVCNTCHLRNNEDNEFSTKDFATRFDPVTYESCKAYKDNSCCSASTAAKIHDPVAMYGAEYAIDKCQDIKGVQMSEACYKFFVDEACFYECDVNAGKFRTHPDCGRDASGAVVSEAWGAANAWQMGNMPIQASFCDAWYDACAEDYWCSVGGAKSFFGQETGQCTDATCMKFKDVYSGGKEVCEEMWKTGDIPAFLYEPDTTKPAYTMSFDPDQIVNGVRQGNPNNNVHAGCAFLDNCPGHAPPQTLEAACAESGQTCIPNADDCEHEFLKDIPGCNGEEGSPSTSGASAPPPFMCAAYAAAAAAATAAAALA